MVTTNHAMEPSLILIHPPPLDPAWLLYESQLPPSLPPPDIHAHKKNYIHKCRVLNAKLLSGRDSHLLQGIRVTDFTLNTSQEAHNLKYRSYIPTQASINTSHLAIIYYHGGGLYVGDLDSEELTCRRICQELNCIVYSCDYRLMPEHTPDDALSDAVALFRYFVTEKKGPFILAGSSSGGQLAAQVSQEWLRNLESVAPDESEALVGVLLRAPVTCDASEGGKNLPPRFKDKHTSLTPAFYNSLISSTCVDALHRTSARLPLEEENLKGLPKHWIQVCTNDIFYSDGVCYAEALRMEGVEVRLDVVKGWPHTFWLKAPELESAVEAEGKMVEGLRWLMGGV